MAAIGPQLIDPGNQSPRLEYSPEVIDQIRGETVSALQSLPHGGLEIAGILFGRCTGSALYLAARRPIECEHAGGPAFTVSSRDWQNLQALLATCANDPALAGLEPVGWYVSHTRRPPHMSPTDVEIFDRLFPEPLRVTGVVQPEMIGVAQFRWFARNADGWFNHEIPVSEFKAKPRPEERVVQETVEKRPAAVIELPQRVPESRPSTMHPKGRRIVRISNVVLIGAACAVLSLVGGVFWWLRVRSTAIYPPPLHVMDTGRQLRIDWDPRSLAVQRAKLGVLEIKDDTGNPVRINLGQDMIRSGSVLYGKPSNKVEIHLQLRDEKGNQTESMVYFIRPEAVVAKVAEPAHNPDRPAPVQTPDIPPAAVTQTVQPTSGTSERGAVVFKPPKPLAVKPVRASETPLIEAPRIPATSELANTPLPLIGGHTEAAPPPPIVTGVPKPKPLSASGRLIWTGDLRRNTVLQLSESRASSGSLNGKLPAQPVKISVRPAQLLDGAIAIYTSDPNGTRSAEAPGRRNGWNVTLYKFDPKHVHDLDIVQMPSESNNWKLGIKSVNRPISIIVIDWQLASGTEPGS